MAENKTVYKQCPFKEKACIKEKCELYTSAVVRRPGRMGGSIIETKFTGCVFLVQLGVFAPPDPGPMATLKAG